MIIRNELHVSVSKRLDGDYTINNFRDGADSTRSIFPRGTDGDVIMLRTWDEPKCAGRDHGQYCALNAHDLWLVAQIRRTRSKKRAAELAAQLAGLA